MVSNGGLIVRRRCGGWGFPNRRAGKGGWVVGGGGWAGGRGGGRGCGGRVGGGWWCGVGGERAGGAARNVAGRDRDRTACELLEPLGYRLGSDSVGWRAPDGAIVAGWLEACAYAQLELEVSPL